MELWLLFIFLFTVRFVFLIALCFRSGKPILIKGRVNGNLLLLVVAFFFCLRRSIEFSSWIFICICRRSRIKRIGDQFGCWIWSWPNSDINRVLSAGLSNTLAPLRVRFVRLTEWIAWLERLTREVVGSVSVNESKKSIFEKSAIVGINGGAFGK